MYNAVSDLFSKNIHALGYCIVATFHVELILYPAHNIFDVNNYPLNCPDFMGQLYNVRYEKYCLTRETTRRDRWLLYSISRVR